MHFSIRFIGLVFGIFHSFGSLASGVVVITNLSPNNRPLHIPYLVKIPPSRKISIASVKPIHACGDVFFAEDTSYPIKEDYHVFICYESPWDLGIGLGRHGIIVVNKKGLSFESTDTAYRLSVVLDDDSNSLVMLQNDAYILFNYTFYSARTRISNFRYFALSGNATWEMVSSDSY